MELYHNNDILQKNLWIDVNEIINLEIIWNYENNKYYTLIIYDIDTVSLYIHLLVTNIPQNDIEYGTIISNFKKPNPPFNTHRYIIAVFEQSGLIADSKFNTRDRFSLSDFIKKNNLHLLYEKMIISSTNEFYLADSDDLKSNGLIVDSLNKKYNNSKNSLIADPSKSNHLNNIVIQKSNLNDKDQKYCSCVIRVAEKNTNICNLEENWGKTIAGKTCYSPYAVCAKNIGTTSRECGLNYNYEAMTKEQLITFLNLKKVKVNKSLHKNQLLEIIRNKKI